MDVNQTISKLNKYDEVLIDDGVNATRGHVVDVDDDVITVNIFTHDVDVPIKRRDIKEISLV